jgi:hypothetical protein
MFNKVAESLRKSLEALDVVISSGSLSFRAVACHFER